MSDDRQVRRWQAARTAHHQATQHLREAQHEVERTAAELVTAGADLAERVRLLDATSRADTRRAA